MSARFARSDVIRADLTYDLSEFGAEMIVNHQNRWRSFLATLCLVAVVLLYAPFGAAAWAVYARTCCTSNAQCPIHGHHHAQTRGNAEHAMDCGHEMPGMVECSMSCCQNPDRPVVAPAIFVLPAPVMVSLSKAYEPFVGPSSKQISFNSFEPLSPPPRFSSLAA